jgi:RNA polymerase sigma factor (sigma-70 family)
MTAKDFGSDRTRSSLLEAIKDPENSLAWQRFSDLYAGIIRNAARRAGLREDEIEDVVQIVLIEVSNKIRNFDYDRSKGKFRGWLCTLAARRAIDKFRKRQRAEEKMSHRHPADNRKTTLMNREEDMDESGVERFMDKEWKRAFYDLTLQGVRKRVTADQFQLYDAYVLKEWSVEKVSKTFGVTPNQIYIAKTRVGKIAQEEGERVAEEMGSPDLSLERLKPGALPDDR